MKRIISGVLAMALVLGGTAALPQGALFGESVITASAAQGNYYGFDYGTYNDGTVELLRYKEDSDTTITIPSEVAGSNKIYFSRELVSYLNYETPATALVIGPHILDFSSYNVTYTDAFGVIYTYYDGDKGAHPYIIPNGMHELTVSEGLENLLTLSGTPIVAGRTNIEYITLPADLKALGSYSLFGLTNLKRISFPKESKLTLKAIEESQLGYYKKGSSYVKNTSFVIECYKGSAAETYAKQNGFKCWIVDADEQDAFNGLINIAEMDISTPKDKYVCTGKQIKPAIIIKNGSEVLQEDVDYTLEYQKNIYVGQGTVTIKGMGDYSGSKVFTFSIIPANVSGFNAFAYSKSATELRWNAVTGADGYIIYKYDDAAKTYKRAAVIDGGKVTQHFFWALESGTTYKYAIKAFGIAGSSKEVTSAKYPTATVSTKPDTVNFKLTSAKKTVKITWDKVKGAKGYIVYYKTSPNGKWIKLTTTNKTTFKQTGLNRNTTYYYTVKAYRKVNGVQYNGGFTTKSIATK